MFLITRFVGKRWSLQ